jgi:aminopeptidase N
MAGTEMKSKTRIPAIAFRAACGLFAALVFITPALAQRRERVVDEWKPLHYDVAISFNDQLTEIARAQTEITAQILKDNVSMIDLDFGSMPIDSVTIGVQPARYERKPELLNVFLGHAAHAGDQVSIVVTYHGHPTDGLVFATDRDGKPSATGDNWPNRVHQWIPCLDHPSAKATVSFKVSAPQRDTVIANGKFVSLSPPDLSRIPNVWRFEEAKPIPAYCMVIAVSEGAKLDANQPTVTPLSYYVPQKDRAFAAKGFSSAAPALAFFSETIAPYPYEKLALIIGATRFGGMENSSAIVFTNTLFDPRGNEKMSKRFGIPSRIEDVVAHEIAHQWFGDSVTESTWADLWLSEGFATYFAGLFIEKYDGEDAFRDYLHNAAERCFAYEKQRNTPIHDTETQDLMRLLNENNYQKGAWVLHMLRKRLGDEVFFRGLRGYYRAHAEANATTEDLRDALEKASGQNLHDFFTRWVYGTGHPIYQMSWSWKSVTEKNVTVTITLNQTQAGFPFLDPVPVEIVTRGLGTKRVMITPTGRTTTAQLTFSRQPDAVTLDPDETLLREIVPKP